ncbi:MAG: hypothetical protein F6K03_09460 [Kamptonema sp. SIO4C4]|nr:hypothetical protein [Kamptonema sp. SIO4C4]
MKIEGLKVGNDLNEFITNAEKPVVGKMLLNLISYISIVLKFSKGYAGQVSSDRKFILGGGCEYFLLGGWGFAEGGREKGTQGQKGL